MGLYNFAFVIFIMNPLDGVLQYMLKNALLLKPFKKAKNKTIVNTKVN